VQEMRIQLTGHRRWKVARG